MSDRETQIFVRKVDEEIWKQFKIFVLRKYGKLSGVLGPEISAALMQYLEKHKNVHTHEGSVNPNSNSNSSSSGRNLKVRNAAKIAAKILDLKFKKLHEQQLNKITTMVTGFAEKRTLQSYMNILIEHGVLKISQIASQPYFPGISKKKRRYFVFEVVRENAEKFVRIYGEKS